MERCPAVGLLDVYWCPILGQVPREVALEVNGSLRSWPSGSSAETSSCSAHSCSEVGACQTKVLSEQGLVPLVLRCVERCPAVGLLDVYRCPLLGQVPREVALEVDGSLRSLPSGFSAERSPCSGYSCSEVGTCRTRYSANKAWYRYILGNLNKSFG